MLLKKPRLSFGVEFEMRTKLLNRKAESFKRRNFTHSRKMSCYQFSKINKLMTVCSYHVKYGFQSESTHCSCLNVKDLLTQNRRDT